MNEALVHRLGMFGAAGLVLGWLVWWLTGVRRGRRARRRLAGLLGMESGSAVSRHEIRAALRSWLPLVGVGCAGWVLVGGVLGGVAGAGVAAGLWWWRRRQSGAAVADRAGASALGSAGGGDAREAARQLPLAADLLAACISAGAGPVIAAQAVGEALGGPVGKALARGAAEVRLGGKPAAAWEGLASSPGAGPLARLLERADVSGLPAAEPAVRLAADARAQWARDATARARRAAVMVTAPVGLCFLPAFIAVGVLPVVIGLAGEVLGGGGG
ncbi:type II secretion system F family protein [Streptomyces sp. NPDC057877]|uniref:type II secretion system F family protein n=1 Tax=Streptomyces sp. NPDC057877 TaxID=3346269 RepID=UPI003690D7A5